MRIPSPAASSAGPAPTIWPVLVRLRVVASDVADGGLPADEAGVGDADVLAVSRYCLEAGAHRRVGADDEPGHVELRTVADMDAPEVGQDRAMHGDAVEAVRGENPARLRGGKQDARRDDYVLGRGEGEGVTGSGHVVCNDPGHCVALPTWPSTARRRSDQDPATEPAVTQIIPSNSSIKFDLEQLWCARVCISSKPAITAIEKARSPQNRKYRWAIGRTSAGSQVRSSPLARTS